MDYTVEYLNEMMLINTKLAFDFENINKIKDIILTIRKNKGRLFFLGVGGSAGNASHAVNDFRKIAGIETYAPTDNVSELTARVNDDGWENVFTKWLQVSDLNEKDAIFILSVGGGNVEKKVSVNLVNAIDYAKSVKANVLGIVGRDGGYTAKLADACVVIPTVNEKTITPHTEAYQGVILHLLVTHPDILKNEMKWESLSGLPVKKIK